MNFRYALILWVFVLVSQGLLGEENIHTVQRGETLYSIARTFGVKADDLIKYNGITDPGRLMAGQRIKIPSSEPASGSGAAGAHQTQGSAPANTGFVNYRVLRGDTLFSIARRFSVTVGAIQEANKLPQNHLLREGDSLKIPSQSTIPRDSANPNGSGNTQDANPPETRNPQNHAGTSSADFSLVRWPVTGREFSNMTGKLSGVVITGTRTESVTSLTRGTVLSAGPYRGFGRVVIVQVEGGYLYVYGGMESLSVKEGDRLGPGAELGKLGIDAVSNKPH
ncbi:MAG: M23 family metallopeptidase, partial [Treponema sp.]|nr:M23 family metallopeptidase [Treponema sp.]